MKHSMLNDHPLKDTVSRIRVVVSTAFHGLYVLYTWSYVLHTVSRTPYAVRTYLR
jgi:hypothetical protein